MFSVEKTFNKQNDKSLLDTFNPLVDTILH